MAEDCVTSYNQCEWGRPRRQARRAVRGREEEGWPRRNITTLFGGGGGQVRAARA
jgi:hypothetical protein